MQRALNVRRAALRMPIRNPEDANPDRSQLSTATDYFDNICDQHVRLVGGSFLEVFSHLQGRLMQSSHGGEGGDPRMLIFLVLEE
ncbi:hypothetical protein DY000_02013951 [Brassica cretica]|uniref:Uncharacterized protein n=1 Tax=Brassica cretica TaxID=69181 RepID=A0ABQ7CVS2_BRACR|nr:hypothetical protein DY000_02013951 [Brassica cretica]